MSQRFYPCKRKGCQGMRGDGQFLCQPCWHQVPLHDRNAYVAARRRRLTGIAAKWKKSILEDLRRKPMSVQPLPPCAAPPAPITATQAYRRTCALLGEQDEAA